MNMERGFLQERIGVGLRLEVPESPFCNSLHFGMTGGTETLVFGTRSIPSGHRHFQGPGYKQRNSEEFEVQLLAYFLHGQLHFQGSLAGQWDLTVLGHILAELTYVICSP